MNRLAAATLAAFLAATPASAELVRQDKWTVECAGGAITDARTCISVVEAVVETSSGRKAVLVTVGRDGDRAMASVMIGDTFCNGKAATIRVDRNSAVSLRAAAENFSILEGHAAGELVEQMRAGESALVRVYTTPGCKKLDFLITLKGFTAAWYQLGQKQ